MFVSSLPDEKARAFCTWKVDQELRGCIGSLDKVWLKQIPLLAQEAALRDRRFSPLTRDELLRATLTISILSEPRVARSLDDWVLGRDGLILTSNHGRATFLPSVPVENGWTKRQTLEHLARKGGFSLGSDIVLQKYRVKMVECG
jgi:AmmeMemoRadiSam system protein A